MSGSIAKFLYDAADIFFSRTLVGLEATLPKIGVLSACVSRAFLSSEIVASTHESLQSLHQLQKEANLFWLVMLAKTPQDARVAGRVTAIQGEPAADHAKLSVTCQHDVFWQGP